MGNVLGFQFRHDYRERVGDRSGELRFYHCNVVGRELLMRLGDLCAVDGRPGSHVLLMSATSWAGTRAGTTSTKDLKSEAQTFVTVEDFWGGLLVGFLTGYSGTAAFSDVASTGG